MKDVITWLVHTPAGIAAILAAIGALVYAKGSDKHRFYGRVFVLAMLVMLAAGCASALLKSSPNDVFLGLIVGYSVFTAWLSVSKLNRKRKRLLEYVALGWISLIGLSAITIAPLFGYSGESKPFIVWPVLALFFIVGDLANIVSGGYSGLVRIRRHIWRIGFAMIWSASAVGDKIVKMQGSTVEQSPYIVAIPVLLIVAIFLYWISMSFVAFAEKNLNS